MITIEEAIDDLLDISEVPKAKRQEARRELSYWLIPVQSRGSLTVKSRARSIYDAAGQRGGAEAHNHHLRKVQAAAAKLDNALKALRKRPYAHLDFWDYPEFGPVYDSEYERGGVFESLSRINAAAEAACIERKGGGALPKTGQRRMVELALSFFDRHGDVLPSEDEQNPFRSFSERFYEAAIGAPPKRRSKTGDSSPLLRQVRDVLGARNKSPEN